jgi:DNA-binding HxlR family transcriptional regulator
MVANKPLSGNKVAYPSAGDMVAPGITPAAEARLPQFERLIHERIRLGIVSALAVCDHLSFIELRKLLKTSDGNLSVHARKLEQAGYVACSKYFEDRIPKTEYRLTVAGRDALHRYLNHMETLIQAMKGITQEPGE